MTRKLPIQTIIGVTLIAIAWPIAWLQLAPLSYFSFLYLWLGYILSVDGLNVARHGSSLLTRSPAHFLFLFILSAPVWWLFEFLNAITQNWHYLGGYVFGDYADLVATIHFSTVIPAVFETAEWVGSFAWTQRCVDGRRCIVNRLLEVATLVLGIVSVIAMIANPDVAFGLLWMFLLLILDPINAWLRRPSLLRQVAQGDWRNIVSLAVAGLICGFFWEMWNFYSYPKWYYTVPHVGFWKIFEMPLLGYIGYLPFAMELYAIYQLVSGLASGLVGWLVKSMNRQTN